MATTTLVDLVKIVSQTTGTGALTLGAAVPGYRGPEVLQHGRTYSYSIQQGAAFEFGRGTYLETSNQLVRAPLASSDGGTPINLLPNATIAFTILSEDLPTQNSVADAEAAAALADAFANSDSDEPVLGQDDPDARGAKYFASIAGDHAGDAESAAERAEGAQALAETAADNAALASNLYASEATGNAAVADGARFAAVGAATTRAIDIWQRVSAGTSTLLRSYPSFETLTGISDAAIAVGRPLATTLLSGSASTNTTRVFNTALTQTIAFNKMRIRTADNGAHTVKWRRFATATGVQVPNDGKPGSVGHDVSIAVPALGVGGGYTEIAFTGTGYPGEFIGFYGPANTYAVVTATGDEAGYYSKTGDVTDMSGAALNTTSQLQIAFEGTYQAVTGAGFVDVKARVATAEVQTAKVPALDASAAVTPAVNVWPWLGMDIPDANIFTSTFAAQGNAIDHIICFGEEAPFFEILAAGSGNIIRNVQIPMPTGLTTGDTVAFDGELETTKPGNSGAICSFFWTDNANATVGTGSGNGYIDVGTTGRAKIKNAAGTSLSAVMPSTATKLWLQMRLNSPVAGDYARWRFTQGTKGTRASAMPNRNRTAYDLGRCSVNVRRFGLIYMSDTGSDTNSGSRNQPVATLARAIALGQANTSKHLRIHIRKQSTGVIVDPGVQTLAARSGLTITADDGVIIKAGTDIAPSATKTSSRNYIYEAPLVFDQANRMLHYIYAEITNPAYAISNTERMPQMRDALTRAPFWLIEQSPYAATVTDAASPALTPTELGLALDEIDAAPTGTAYFVVDPTNSKIYFRMPDNAAPGSRKVYVPIRYWLAGTSAVPLPGDVQVQNLTIYYGGIQVGGERVTIEDVTILGAYIDAIQFAGIGMLRRVRCGFNGGDGISPHGANRGQVDTAWLHNNYDDGWSNHEDESLWVLNDVLAERNVTGGGFVMSNANTILNNCVSRGNTKIGYGGLVNLASADQLSTIVANNFKSIDDANAVNDQAVTVGPAIGRMEVNNLIAIRPTAKVFEIKSSGSPQGAKVFGHVVWDDSAGGVLGTYDTANSYALVTAI